jgi:hypothetical protein
MFAWEQDIFLKEIHLYNTLIGDVQECVADMNMNMNMNLMHVVTIYNYIFAFCIKYGT